jgi:MoaA/NifB/PqqE/SkfB family radical SAM enzyme
VRTFPDVLTFVVSAAISALDRERFLNCLWELTYRCTAKCGICGYWRNPSLLEDELGLSDIKTGLERIYRHGCRVVNFTGGEPTIRKDLEQIVQHASNLGMWTSVVTNGSLMTRSRMQELKDAGLDNLFVSLDSLVAEEHDARRGVTGLHTKVIDCMHWLSEDFLTWHRTGGMMCVLSSMNVHEVEGIVKLADALGVYVVFQPYHVNKTGNSGFAADIDYETISGILQLKRQHRSVLSSDGYLRGFLEFSQRGTQQHCHAGQKYFSIDPYGFLHPCVDLPVAGHVLKDDVSIVRSPEAMRDVHCCPGCWYCFRGEADSTFSYGGCLQKLWLGLGVTIRNERRAMAKGSRRAGAHLRLQSWFTQ